MNTEAQRIAIARAIGHKMRNTWSPWAELPNGDVYLVPNYPTCLNAMHEAEETLTHEQFHAMNEVLYEMPAKALPRVWRATAAQRAEAFLRTLNLWDDSK